MICVDLENFPFVPDENVRYKLVTEKIRNLSITTLIRCNVIISTHRVLTNRIKVYGIY